MSVIYYSDDRKFLNIARTLGIGEEARELMHIFGYPEGWKNEPEKIIERFVQGLCDANTEAYNLRYDEKIEKRVLNFNQSATTLNQYELIKSLHSLNYNMVESENYRTTKDHCFHVVYFLMDRIISNMPEYAKAITWE